MDNQEFETMVNNLKLLKSDMEVYGKDKFKLKSFHIYAVTNALEYLEECKERKKMK
jgi:hypothetical protein